MSRAVMERTLSYWLAQADTSQVRTSWLLAVAVTLDADELTSVATTVWPDLPNDEAQLAAIGLAESPFIESGSDGMAFRGDVSPILSQLFADSDPQAFRRAHEALLDLESTRLTQVENATAEDRTDNPLADYDQWHVEARMAFYLAAIDGAASERLFAAKFASGRPDSEEARVPRSWLAHLGIRQSYLLGDDSRTVQFMRAYSSYIRGDRNHSDSLFREVLEGAGEIRTPDEYDAVAAHLWAVRQPYESEEALQFLRRAVAFSEQLDLPVNLIMSRNSLVYRLLSRGLVDDATAAAQLNLKDARFLGDPYLINWCLVTSVGTRREVWSRSNRQPTAQEMTEAQAHLAEAIELSRDLADLETETLAVNESTQLWFWAKDFASGLDAVEEFLDTVSRLPRPDASRRLSQTLGAARRSIAPDLREALEALRQRLDEWS